MEEGLVRYGLVSKGSTLFICCPMTVVQVPSARFAHLRGAEEYLDSAEDDVASSGQAAITMEPPRFCG